MKIGIDIRPVLAPQITGVGYYSLGLIRNLLKDKAHDYILFYNSFKDVSDFIPSDFSASVVRTRFPNKIFHLSLALIGKPEIDSIIAKKNRTTAGSCDLDIFISPNLHFTALGSNTKHILTIHDLSFFLFPEYFSLWRRLWHRALGARKQAVRANAIIVPSTHTKHDVVRYFGVPPEKVYVVPPTIFAQDFTFRAENSNRAENIARVRATYKLPKKFLLFLGTIEPRKNIISAIRAFVVSDLPAQGYEFVIAGGRGWKCSKIFKKIKQTPGVRHIGFVPEADKPALYAAADIFVYPSFYEGFGLPVLEAFAAGTPVITSNVSSLPEVAEGAAYLIEPHNVADITRAMNVLVQDADLRKVYLEKATAVVAKNFARQPADSYMHVLSGV